MSVLKTNLICDFHYTLFMNIIIFRLCLTLGEHAWFNTHRVATLTGNSGNSGKLREFLSLRKSQGTSGRIRETQGISILFFN